MADKQKLTKAGVAKLEEELRNLIDNVREEVKRQLAEVEGRIKEIESILHNYELIDESSKASKRVGLGSTVTVKFLETGKEASYMLVGTVESDPVHGKISNDCPMGSALLGKNVGDVVEIKAASTYKVEITKIEIK